MTIALVVTEGFGNGTFSGIIAKVVTEGFGSSAAVPTGNPNAGGFISAGIFTRKKWREIDAEERRRLDILRQAEREARARIQEIEKQTERRKAFEAEQEANEAVLASFRSQATTARLTKAFEGVAEARRGAELTKRIAYLHTVAAAILAKAGEDDEDEDDILDILMMQ